MKQYKISGLPITEKGKLVGILTNRDLRFETRMDLKISALMTKDNLITVPVGTTLEKAKRILHRHRVEKLPVVDAKYRLKGTHHGQGHSKEDRLSERVRGFLGKVEGGCRGGSNRRFPRSCGDPGFLRGWMCWSSIPPMGTPSV